jgi:sugar phosphate isomerase/epimerase
VTPLRPAATTHGADRDPARLLGAFARIFPIGTADTLARSFAAYNLTQVQLNLSALGHPTIPTGDALAGVDLAGIATAMRENGRVIWGVSATYNAAHPDEAVRAATTTGAARFIAALGPLGAMAATLCTGTRDRENMWRAHPDNGGTAAWRALRRSLDVLLPAAASSGVLLAIEPEPGNVVAGTAEALRLVRELGADATRIGFILDPANLVATAPREDHARILRKAFAALGDRAICVHVKDTVPWTRTLAGDGVVDYDLVLALHRGLPRAVPLIIQDATPIQLPVIVAMLRRRLNASGAA